MGWISNGSGLSATDRAKLNALSLKNNLSASVPPTVNDDSSKGYSSGSIWIALGTAYACVDATVGKAVWISTNDTFYFSTYAEFIAAISAAGTQYVGKYCNIANANTAPSGGITYIAGQPLNDYIVDGGSATYKVNMQGTSYSITCQPRTIVNPVVTSVMLIPSVKPTARGYYIFAVVPIGGLPNGIALNDIAYYDGSNWSLFQSYSNATTVLVANNVSGGTQVTWRKFAGTWMSTADEYIPDGKEYQTGKLYNGKAVYRKCTAGTTGTGSGVNSWVTGLSIPMTGKRLLTSAIISRSDNIDVSIVGTGAYQVFITANGYLAFWNDGTGTLHNGRPFTAWVEYTKS